MLKDELIWTKMKYRHYYHQGEVEQFFNLDLMRSGMKRRSSIDSNDFNFHAGSKWNNLNMPRKEGVRSKYDSRKLDVYLKNCLLSSSWSFVPALKSCANHDEVATIQGLGKGVIYQEPRSTSLWLWLRPLEAWNLGTNTSFFMLCFDRVTMGLLYLYLQKYPILAVFGPSCRPSQFFMVQNCWYRCPTYSTTCFMLDPHL